LGSRSIYLKRGKSAEEARATEECIVSESVERS